MSKRAVQKALEAYPDGSVYIFGEASWDCRIAMEKGYEQAEKDMKERFIQFVHRHYPINYTGWIQDFQRAMEEE